MFNRTRSKIPLHPSQQGKGRMNLQLNWTTKTKAYLATGGLVAILLVLFFIFKPLSRINISHAAASLSSNDSIPSAVWDSLLIAPDTTALALDSVLLIEDYTGNLDSVLAAIGAIQDGSVRYNNQGGYFDWMQRNNDQAAYEPVIGFIGETYNGVLITRGQTQVIAKDTTLSLNERITSINELLVQTYHEVDSLISFLEANKTIGPYEQTVPILQDLEALGKNVH